MYHHFVVHQLIDIDGFFVYLFVFRDRVLVVLCPGTPSVDEAGPEVTEIPPVFSSPVVGLMMCATIACLIS